MVVKNRSLAVGKGADRLIRKEVWAKFTWDAHIHLSIAFLCFEGHFSTPNLDRQSRRGLPPLFKKAGPGMPRRPNLFAVLAFQPLHSLR
jgi:hypothetical protein